MTSQLPVLYRVIFLQEDKVYEMYARYLTEESLMGFIEIEELIFSDTVNPANASEQQLRDEFVSVKRSYIPQHLILRIDEVDKTGGGKIKAAEKANNVRHLPGMKSKPATCSDEHK